MSEKRELPYTPPDLVVGADPFGRRRQRPAVNEQLDALIESQSQEYAVEQLRRAEIESWSAFFGESIEVPRPPAKLLKFLKLLEEQDIGHMVVHYLPAKEIFSRIDQSSGLQLNEYQGIQVPPAELYKELLDKESLKSTYVDIKGDLPGMWIATDTYSKIQESDDPDPYAEALRTLRERGTLPYHEDPESREGLDRTYVAVDVCEEVSYQFQVPRFRILPISYLQYNILGNVFHPEWGESDNSIWFDDYYVKDSQSTYKPTYGGRKTDTKNGLADFNVGEMDANNGFKFVMEFPA